MAGPPLAGDPTASSSSAAAAPLPPCLAATVYRRFAAFLARAPMAGSPLAGSPLAELGPQPARGGVNVPMLVWRAVAGATALSSGALRAQPVSRLHPAGRAAAVWAGPRSIAKKKFPPPAMPCCVLLRAAPEIYLTTSVAPQSSQLLPPETEPTQK